MGLNIFRNINYIVKKIFCIVFGLLLQFTVPAQDKLPVYHDSLFSTYYHQRVSLFNSLPASAEEIIFLGNSITDGNEWSELFNDKRLKNHGISGDITAGIIHRIEDVAKRKPRKVFLLIGTNDLARNVEPDSIIKNILSVSTYLRKQSPSTRLYVQSILPVNDVYGKFQGHTSKAAKIISVNKTLKEKAAANHYTFIDLHAPFSDSQGKLKQELTNDGLHLNGNAYLLWKHILYPYVYDLQQVPSLIPMPQQVKWNNKKFPLYSCNTITIYDKILAKEAERIQEIFETKGLTLNVADKSVSGKPHIELKLDKNFTAPQSNTESYRLIVDTGKISIMAKTVHGVYNGIQTLSQLARDGVLINTCEISDWPAFSWRGYMIDVGRNFMSMDLLKQQIDVMARYKFNVFHFHATEDIAWRIAIKQYPQLTAPENMLRNKGMYYTEKEVKELIAYCRERHITFVPEIDMPGHSAAFTRAMKTNMQSDSGMIITKNILKEFFETYDLPYIHIGADEVKITNKNFVPEITSFLQKLGKKVIGWEPGGNFIDNTIRQMWMDDNAHISSDTNIQYIDSKHLYLNHMDPLEAVVTIFNRKISNKEKGDRNAIGSTLCIWHDRNVAKEEDVLQMNPVYPGMLAFAERSWQGGGQSGWVAHIGDPGSRRANEFEEFENRFLDHKQQYFSQLSFPYTKQSNLVWKLYGPYNNEGGLSRQFPPETKAINELPVSKTTVGGTIIWRHWWAPLITSVLDRAKENTTWYASTTIWSEEDRLQKFWIGFNNLSRSPATDSPLPGTWDNHESRIWLNGQIIPPPKWTRGGQKGHPEIPLIDEGYEYRKPVELQLKKGWNKVLVKSPIGSFKGKDWQNPEKWMFTFVPID